MHETHQHSFLLCYRQSEQQGVINRVVSYRRHDQGFHDKAATRNTIHQVLRSNHGCQEGSQGREQVKEEEREEVNGPGFANHWSTGVCWN